MLVDGTKPHAPSEPLAEAEHVCPAPIARPFPIGQAGVSHTADKETHSASGSEAEDATPPHHPAPGAPIKLASVAMLHLTSPEEFTFLFASPPLPLFFESLSLQEREA